MRELQREAETEEQLHWIRSLAQVVVTAPDRCGGQTYRKETRGAKLTNCPGLANLFPSLSLSLRGSIYFKCSSSWFIFTIKFQSGLAEITIYRKSCRKYKSLKTVFARYLLLGLWFARVNFSLTGYWLRHDRTTRGLSFEKFKPPGKRSSSGWFLCFRSGNQ